MGRIQKQRLTLLALMLFAACHIASAQKHHQMQKVKAELDYYLKRHNVRDEGFDMVARYAQQGDSTLGVYHPHSPLLLSNYVYPRRGKVIMLDSLRRPIVGLFHADTLASGVRLDSAGVYAGQLYRNQLANGHGSFRSIDGSYYEGRWTDDQRHGFGFCVSPTFLKAGQWRANQFRGERMLYTTERIYGIDISRYQHEKGRKKFSIDWNRLRITHLSRRIGSELIEGTPDYPVSFVFIKSTEGISIVNQYYEADYRSARAHHIPVGAYHFFSTRQTPTEQASHFLQNTHFRQGDLPPILDIEPSDAQIEQMGGAEALFRSVRIWLGAVEKATHCRPILYVNQRFVNKFLDKAPDLKRDYHFWIARYGEYKPDIHLDLWQLSADGRVQGIAVPVDINVFNGYQGQWDEFLRTQCVPER